MKYNKFVTNLRIRLYGCGCKVLMWILEKMRELSRWLWSRSLPPCKLIMLYRKWFIKRQELRHME